MDQHDQIDQIDIFLSYAGSDGKEIVARLAQDLGANPRFAPFYDLKGLRGHEGFDRALEAAITRADVVLVVLTRGMPDSDWCRDEIIFARDRKKDVMVAQMHPDVSKPISIIRLPPFDFASDRDSAFADLVEELTRRAKPDRVADALGDQISGAMNATDARHRDFIRENRERQEEERRRAADPPAAQQRTEARIGTGLRKDQTSGAQLRASSRLKLINEMPAIAKTTFQDRQPKLEQLNKALSDPAVRVVFLIGEAGNGKTAVIGEIRKRLIDGESPVEADGFIYLAVGSYRRVTAGTLLHDLTLVARDEDAGVRADGKLRERMPWRDKLDAVLAALGSTPAVVAIDDLDGLFDQADRLRDNELGEVLRDLVHRPGHRIRLLLAAKRTSPVLLRDYRPHVALCELDEGLPVKDVKPFLLELDATGVLGINAASETDIRRLAVVSGGNPRFLELLYCLLRSDPDLSLESVLTDLAPVGASPAEAAAALRQRIVGRLARPQRRIVQALAAYRRPVRPEAVDFLLQEYVSGIDSAPDLQRLEERRLIRRDGDRYFLPPEPDAEDIFTTVPPDSDGDWKIHPTPFTRSLLRHRAADYFGRVGDLMEAKITGLDDLQPRFSEIDLRIAAGGHRRALATMEALDEKYLTWWGQSDALSPWRDKIKGKAGSPRLEAHNLSFLVAARGEEEDHDGTAEAQLTEAMGQLSGYRNSRARLQIRIQFADLRVDNGRLTEAADRYRATARHCRLRRMRLEEAWSRLNRGICLARLGRFPVAEKELARARLLVPFLNDDERAATLALTLLNQGWLEGQRGNRGRSSELLNEGLVVVQSSQQTLLEGRLLDGQAALLCDYDEATSAIKLATKAAEFGMRTPKDSLAREANVTLALAYLQVGDLPNAATAAEAAVRHPPGIRALGAWATYGVVLFRQNDTVAARSAFHTACTEAWLRLEREPNEFQAHDAAGLALCGLALCGEDRRLHRAVEAYHTARRLVAAEGARRRAVTQLGLFGDRADPNILATARRAARGEPPVSRPLIPRS